MNEIDLLQSWLDSGSITANGLLTKKDIQVLIDKMKSKPENLPKSDDGEWVSVLDQLPPNETKEYEVCRDGNVEFDVWYYRDGKGYWYNYLGITHWKEKSKLPCR